MPKSKWSNNIHRPLKAIRKNCLDCSAGQRTEVRYCTIIECPLYPYRFGKQPTKEDIDKVDIHFSKNPVAK